MKSKNLATELEAICGQGNVLTSPEDLLCYSYDASPTPRSLPQGVVFPRSATEVTAVMRLVSRSGLGVVPRGAGTGLSGGSIPLENSLVLCLTRMNRILEIDERNLFACVEPGVVTAQLHSAVEARGLFYPPDPASASVSTIGGNVATGAGGLRALKYGVTRHYVLGLEAVLASGEVAQTGGKTVKEVAGYDLTRLLVGSEGTLGVFTQITLKLLPLPQAKKTLLVSFRDEAEAAATVSAILSQRFLPSTLEFMDRTTLRCVEAFSPVGLPQQAGAVLLIEVDGAQAAVEEEAQGIAQLCSQQGAVQVRLARSKVEGEELVKARRSVLPALARLRPTVLLEDATVPPTCLVEVVRGTARIGGKYQLPVGTMGHAGDGNLHPYLLCDERDEEEMRRVEAAVEEIMALALSLGGTVSGEHGIGLAKARFLPDKVKPPALEVMKGIKRVFDPQKLLNRGKLFPDV